MPREVLLDPRQLEMRRGVEEKRLPPHEEAEERLHRHELRLDGRGGVGPAALLRGRVQLALVALEVLGPHVGEGDPLRPEPGEKLPHVAHVVLGRALGVPGFHVLGEEAEEPLVRHGHTGLLVSVAGWRVGG